MAATCWISRVTVLGEAALCRLVDSMRLRLGLQWLNWAIVLFTVWNPVAMFVGLFSCWISRPVVALLSHRRVVRVSVRTGRLLLVMRLCAIGVYDSRLVLAQVSTLLRLR